MVYRISVISFFSHTLKKKYLKGRRRSYYHCFTSQEILAKLKPEAWISVLVSHMGVRDAGTWSIACCLPGLTLAESWNQKMLLGTPAFHVVMAMQASQLASFLFLKHIFIWKSKLNGEGETEIFHLLAHSLDVRNSQGWARQRPRAFAHSFMWLVGAQTHGPSWAAFPRVWAGSWIQVEWVEHKLALMWADGVTGFTCCVSVLVPLGASKFTGAHILLLF